MLTNPQFPVDLFTFTKKILNGKLHFLCGDSMYREYRKETRITSKSQVS